MRWSEWKRWIGRRSDEDFAAEVESHLAMEVERLVQGGMSEDEARFAARRAFGNLTAPREQFHDSRPWSGFESLAQDARYALRAMHRAPAFTAIAVTSLAIGIGANTTMFGAIDTLLVRTPAHIHDADRIHRVYFQNPSPKGEGYTSASQGFGTYMALRDHVPELEAVGAFWAHTLSSGRGADARPLDAVLVTPSVFAMLGVRPTLGRFFAADEERDDRDHVAVLGYDAWRAQYNGDSSVLGRSIDVAGTPYVIIGVAPEGFTGVDLNRVDLWLPIGAAVRFFSASALSPNAGSYWLSIIVKRRANVSVAQATGPITGIYRDLFKGSPRYEATFAKAVALLGPVIAARGPTPVADARVSLWVAAVSLLVLLIASANVANLLLLRGLTRSRETALRLSLGATRWRVIRHALVEGTLLALAGALCAIVLARWSATAMHAFLLPHAVRESVFDPRLLAFTALVALTTGVLASVVPAFVTAHRDFGPLLGGGRVAGGTNRLRLQRVLIGGQVALATLLLVGAGLFVTSLRNVHGIDLGLDAEHLLYINIDLGSRRQMARDPAATASANATYAAILDRVRDVPGVMNATVTVGEPLASGWAISIKPSGGRDPLPGTVMPFARAVGTKYFETMGTALVRGRSFTAADHVPNAHVAIIDESAAKQYLPDGSGLDPCVHLGSDPACTAIVGVVKNTVMWNVTGDKGSIVYVPLETQADQAATMIEVRTTGDPAALIAPVRQAVLSVSPTLPWVDIQPVSARLNPQYRPWQLGASMFTAFGVLALCLAAVGLYGLLSYVVTQRSQEIGIRKALGAPDGGVVRMVLRGALGMTVAGITIGIAIALAGGRLIASQLYGVSPRDPAVIVVCAATLLVVTVLACLAPARRATRVDPMVALRAE